MKLVLVATLLTLSLAGCSGQDEAAAPRTETLSVTLGNQPEREFGDLLDEPLRIRYVLDDGRQMSAPSGEVTLDPGESEVVEFDVAHADEYRLEIQASSASGTSSSLELPYTQEQCGSQDVVHADLRFHATLTAGSWKWGFEFEDDCLGTGNRAGEVGA